MRNHIRHIRSLKAQKARLQNQIQKLAARKTGKVEKMLELLEDRLAAIDERIYREHTGVNI